MLRFIPIGSLMIFLCYKSWTFQNLCHISFFPLFLHKHCCCCRYLRPLVADVAVVPKCHLSALYIHEKGKLFTQLVDLLQFYEGFEINDDVGKQLTDDDVLQSHYDRVQSFQLLAFKKIPKLQQLALVQLTTEMISVKDCLYFPLKN